MGGNYKKVKVSGIPDLTVQQKGCEKAKQECRAANCGFEKLYGCSPIVLSEAVSIMTSVAMPRYKLPCMCSMGMAPLMDHRYQLRINSVQKVAENSNNEIFIPRPQYYASGARWTVTKFLMDGKGSKPEAVCQYAIVLKYYQCSARTSGKYFLGKMSKAQRCTCAAQQERTVNAEMTYDKYGQVTTVGTSQQNHRCRATFVYVEGIVRSVFGFLNAVAARRDMRQCLSGCG